MAEVFGYSRCSTDEKKQDITRQTSALIELGVKKENIYFEYESGSKEDRIQLKRLLEKVQPGDSIYATEVSRISRSTKQLCEIINMAKKKQIQLKFGALDFDCRKGEIDPVINAMLQMTAVFAELERNMISERVKSGMAHSKEKKGTKFGRKEITYDKLPETFKKHYHAYKERQFTRKEFMDMCGIKSKTTLSKYMNIMKEGER